MGEDVFSYANLANATFLEGLYQRYLEDPSSVDPSWRGFFAGMEFAKGSTFSKEEGNDARVFRLIEAYKQHGHKQVLLDPLKTEFPKSPQLDLTRFGFGSEDLPTLVSTYGFLEEKVAPLSTLIQALEKKFSSKIGLELMGLSEEMDLWAQPYLEKLTGVLPKEDRLRIFDDLLKAELFEAFIHSKYPGQTRFSIEGGETLIPLLNFLIEAGSELGVEEIVLGMTHRGRLNVRAHVFQESYERIFDEFDDVILEEGSGDVKYHRGSKCKITTKTGKEVTVRMASNPSHLESADPVVEGQVRALQDLKKDPQAKKKVIPLILHGDASIAGQGVVYETLQMSKLEGYETGGTLHIVVNNHIGYTTLPKDSRSTPYPTDIAKAFGFPVLHVNAERPDECIAAALFAMQIRQAFQIDVFIDLNCYRKHGHNEGDEPTFTQPSHYKKVKQKKGIREIFQELLHKEGLLTEEEVLKKKTEVNAKLQIRLSKDSIAEKFPVKKEERLVEPGPLFLSIQDLQNLAKRICSVPSEFLIHPKLDRLIKERYKMVEDPTKSVIDWGMGELMAYGSLLIDGTTVRLSGQDVCRGTFSHRHATWIDQERAEKYCSLDHLKEGQAPFFIYNSLLSEFAVMGFDLGYSFIYSKALVLWEAQFGDFVNGAQVIIDQYLTTSEQKWGALSNMTLLLPHGYEGKGPEHSSARMERFLQLCAEENLIVANCTTPAQFFHLIRRQASLVLKKPLIVFTPKLLLRHPGCVSNLSEFSKGRFEECLADPQQADPQLNEKVEKVILCSGKVFYDLLEERKERSAALFAILRVEQLYPFPKEKLLALLESYPFAKEVLWVQEEPENMGAWRHVKGQWLEGSFKQLPLRYVGRAESASPATGSYVQHKKQVKHFMQEVFMFKEGESSCK